MSADHITYTSIGESLAAALEQAASIERREYQPACRICEDTGHTAEQCHHNPLMLARAGWEALLGSVFRCFHCDFVTTDEAIAREHFGKSDEEVAACLGAEAERLRVDALRYRFLRDSLLREPMSRNLYGQPTYGAVFECPADMDADVFDRLIDAGRAQDDGKKLTFKAERAEVEAPGGRA